MPEERKLDLSKSVYELCGRYPELMGMKRMKLDAIVAGLKEKGFTIEGGFGNEQFDQ